MLRMHRYSTDPEHEFPLFVTGINVAAACMQALRYQRMNALCNRRCSVAKGFVQFFVALFAQWFTLYRRKQGTVEHVNTCLAEAVALSKDCMAAVSRFEKDQGTGATDAVGSISFTDLENKK